MRRFFASEHSKKSDFPKIETKRPANATYPEIDVGSANSFMYVSNFEKRDYQYDISIEAINNNLLVVIPTGLGKTFIASMIIFNFYRWFPTGKMIFSAPTKPLCEQQFRSVQHQLQIPSNEVVLLTGQIEPSKRIEHWKHARVIFATPQTIQNDLESKLFNAYQIVLLIIDEAHRARGDHAYCKIVSDIAAVTKFFRVVGLSATPGSSFDDIQQIIYSLMISKIELRTDQDCSEYIHTKKITTEIVPDAEGVSELAARLNSLVKPMLAELLKLNLVSHSDPSRTTTGSLGILRKAGIPQPLIPIFRYAYKLLSLKESLQNYSIPIFVHELSEFIESGEGLNEEKKTNLTNLKNTSLMLDQKDPKMEKLIEIVSNFLNSETTSKVLIFCHYRTMVHQIRKQLNKASSVIKCAEFIGQSSKSESKGLNQHDQLQVMENFRKGIYNTLIATAVGEEGLDIGEVDMVICYDTQKSPTRTIQRMGRTGRQRDGNVIFLLNQSQQGFSVENSAVQDNLAKLVKRRMNDFRFYKSPTMNSHKFQVVYKEIQAQTQKKEIKQKELKRATLLSKEISEMSIRFGEEFQYQPKSLISNLFF